MADPGYYVVTPYPEEGRLTVDLRYWTVDNDGRPEVVWPEVGIRYGFGPHWTSELFFSWIGPSVRALRASTLNWQNDWMLTQGRQPFDLALHLQWVRELDGDGPDSLEFGPVFQTELGFTRVNANLFLARELGADRGPTALKYQWQLRRRVVPGLHLGLQGFGELGPWDDWAPHARQSHRAGPAFFAGWPLDDGRTLDLQGAWLSGRTYTRPGHMLSLQLRLGF